mgnify:CR=1 FL=1
MTTILIALHILAAVLFLGPVTVAVSSFHTQALKAKAGDTRAAGTATILHKLTSTYGMLAAIVPLLGVAIMMTDGAYWKQGQFHAAIGTVGLERLERLLDAAFGRRLVEREEPAQLGHAERLAGSKQGGFDDAVDEGLVHLRS